VTVVIRRRAEGGHGINGGGTQVRPIADLDSEHRYLACVLLEPDVIERCPVRPDDMWSPANATVLETMHALRSRGTAIATDTLRIGLSLGGRLDSVGDDTLLSLASRVPNLHAAPTYAAAIQRTAGARRATASAQRAAEAGRRLDLHAMARELEEAREHAAHAEPRERSWLAERWLPVGEREGGRVWLREEPPPREWLLRRGEVPMLARGLVGLLVAPGGRGKTYALCDLAISIATGLPWLGVIDVASRGRVVLALAEEDDAEVRRRLYAVARARGLGEAEIVAAESHIVALGFAGQDVSLVVVDGSTVTPSALQRELLRLVSAHEHHAVLLDPLARWAPGVESDNAVATRAIELFEELAAAARGTVLVAHHTAKWARRDGESAGHGSSARGVTAITDGARWVAELRGGDDDDLALAVVKSNGAALGAPVPLYRDPTSGVLTGRTGEHVSPAGEAHRVAESLAELLSKLAARGPAGVVGQRALRQLVGGRKATAQAAIRRAIREGLIVGGNARPYVVAQATTGDSKGRDGGEP
jgi:hypothetical protein